MNNGSQPLSPDFDKALAKCSPADFDGHTEFSNLTLEQRLEWLYQVASFVSENRGLAREGTCGLSSRNSPDPLA